MSLGSFIGGLASLFTRSTERRRFDLSQLVDDDVWEDVFGESHGSDAGEKVTESTALSIAPVWASVSMISGGCAKIPAKVYKRRQPGPGKDVDYTHQAARFIDIDEMANDETPAYELFRRWYVSALMFSNGYIWADWSRTGELLGLYNLCPDRTGVARVNGQLWYVTETNGDLEVLHRDDVLHLSGLRHGAGAAPKLLKIARHDFGMQLAARKFTSKFFKNGAHLGGVLQLPPGYQEPVRKKIEKALEEQRSGTDKAFRTFVMKEGYRWFQTSVDPAKAMTIELNDEKRRDVANWFCMAPSRLGVKDSTSYNSKEEDKQDFYDTTLSNWLIPAQAQLNTKLRSPSERRTRSHVIRYQASALLWADSTTRADIADKGILSGRFSPDETRAWEDLNPRDDGEGHKYLRPLNMTVAGEDPTPQDPPAPPTDDDDEVERTRRLTSEQRAAMSGLLKSTVRRIGKRLLLHAERAQKRNSLDAWRETAEAEHRDVLLAMLRDVVPAINATAITKPIDARQVADWVFTVVEAPHEEFTASFPDTLADTMASIFFPEPTA